MEEADALGDTVAVLDSGKLRACGTSQFLKRTFGKGHTITLVSEPQQASRVADIVSRQLPSAEIMNSNAGSTSISLPKTAMKGLPRLFAALMAEGSLIKEWSVSNTTLEEVFMRLAAQNETNAAVEGLANNVTRVSIVQRQKNQSVEQGANETVLAILDGLDKSDVAGLEVVLPVETEDHETVVVPLADPDETDAQESGDIVMEQLILPAESAVGGGGGARLDYSATQMIDVVVPLNAEPGQEISITVGGRDVRVPLPMAAAAGSRIQVAIPLPQPDATGPQSTANVVPTTVWQQAFAVAWKSFHLTLNCRREPGMRGCCSLKCCEMTCYLIIFAIMSGLALLNAFVEEEDAQYTNDRMYDPSGGRYDSSIASAVTYCPNGVQSTSLRDTWSGGSQSQGSPQFAEVLAGPVGAAYVAMSGCLLRTFYM